LYYFGLGVPQNYKQAAQWYLKAADKGNNNAMYNLGGMYEKGRGVTKNPDTAIFWWKKAAALGNPLAKAILEMAQSVSEGTFK
jgi:TPR repeat protein